MRPATFGPISRIAVIEIRVAHAIVAAEPTSAPRGRVWKPWNHVRGLMRVSYPKSSP